MTQLWKSYSSRIVIVLILATVANGIALYFPVLLKDLVDTLSTSPQNYHSGALLKTIVAAALTTCLVTALRDVIVTKLAADIDQKLASSIVDKLLKIPYANIKGRNSGEWLLIVRHVQDIKWVFGQMGSQALFDGLLVLGYGALLFHYQVSMGIVYVVFGLSVGLLIQFLGKSIYRSIDSAYQSQARAESRLVEALRNSRLVRAFQLSSWAQSKWSPPYREAVDSFRRADYKATLFGSIFDLIHRTTPVLVLAWKLPEVSNGNLSLGTVLAMSSVLTIGLDPLLKIVALSSQLQKARHGYRKIRELSAMEIEEVAPAIFVPKSLPPVEVQLHQVHFQYPDTGVPILRGLDLQIRPGERIGLVGSNGTGKTTLFHLLMRFYQAQSGLIRFDGRPLLEVPIAELRRSIGLVEQETEILAGSVIDNIALGDPSPDLSHVEDCAELAQCTEFIRRLPDGFHTPLGEQAISLSIGQRQRIALARSVYWNPRLLLLDEPTSSLDPLNETLIAQSLDRISIGRTVITSAHRLKTLMGCDRILVMNEGTVVESGQHHELLGKEGHYSKMWKAAFQ